MKTVSVPAHAKTLNALLKSARRQSLILETRDGERYVVAPLLDWEGFDVGHSKSFTEEGERTAKNKKLIKTLAERKKRDNGRRYSIEEIKRELGID